MQDEYDPGCDFYQHKGGRLQMALTIRKITMPVEKYPIKCPYIMNPTRLVIHNTANDAPAANEIAYMQKTDTQVSFHFAVDDKEAVQGVDMWRNAWHAGDGAERDKNKSSYSYGNLEGIAIEICYSKSGGDRFIKAEQNAAELAARLLLDFGWGIERITKHQDYSGKYCPHRTLDMGWQRFVNMVALKRNELMNKSSASTPVTKTTLNGYTLERAKDFSIIYWDKSKKKGKYDSYINGGFFGYYKRGATPYTLPRGNLVADIVSDTSLKKVAEEDWKKYVFGNKIRCSCTTNPADSGLLNKKVTTFVLPTTGTPYMAELMESPVNARYAISGIPVIRNKVDVSFNNFVKPQGWDNSPFYATSRNFIGLKGTSIWIVSGESKTDNFVAQSEVYNALKDFDFDDLIALDGGGSYYHKYEGKAGWVWKDRDINNIVTF